MTDDTIFTLDRNGLVTSWNEQAERMYGYAGDEIIGRHFSIFYPEDRIAAGYPQAELDWAEKNGAYIDGGWRLRKGDGSLFRVRVLITAQHDASGNVSGFVKHVRPVDQPPESRHRVQTRDQHPDR